VKIIEKLYRRTGMLLSTIAIPRHKRNVRHTQLEDFELLVFANEDVGRQIYLYKSYEPYETTFFKKSIRSTDVCFDIGGNIGYFSMLMSKLANNGKVHVFEPIPLNASLIAVNANLNNFDNIIINNVAVGSESGECQFSVSMDSAYSSMKATGRIAEEKSITVPMITINDYLQANHVTKVDILKVDVEGAEGAIIDAASSLLRNTATRPRIVLLELFDENLKPFGTTALTIVNQMIDYGYKAFVLSKNNGDLIEFKSDMANKYYNVIFTV
jgi:FkbM family methyltransferase